MGALPPQVRDAGLPGSWAALAQTGSGSRPQARGLRTGLGERPLAAHRSERGGDRGAQGQAGESWGRTCPERLHVLTSLTKLRIRGNSCPVGQVAVSFSSADAVLKV